MPRRPTLERRRFRVLARAVGSALAIALFALASAAPPFVPVVAAATAPPANCVLPEDGTEGQIDFDTWRRPIGVVRAVMLFVDFPDVPATRPADTIFEELGGPAASSWLAQSSYGKLSLQITPLRHWLRMPEPLSAFTTVNGSLDGDTAKRYIAEAIALADPEVDFSGVQVVQIVPNPEATAYPRSSEGIYNPDEGFLADGHVLRAIVSFGSTVYERGYRTVAHETSHAFGTRDLYNAFGYPTDKYVGPWSLMADTMRGGDHFAWDKWRMGWLTTSQVRCITAARRSVFVLSPLETNGGVKAVILRTGLKTAVVVEFRTRRGADAGACSTGVLIYKVNSGLRSGAGPIRVSDARPHSARSGGKCAAELDDAPYRAGGRWTDSTSGLEIDVTYIGTAARIRVIRTKTYTPPVRHPGSITANVVMDPVGTVTLTGVVTAADGFAACAAGRQVSLQEWKAGEWWTIQTANTDGSGLWTHTWQPDPGAAYRLLAPQRTTTTDDCARVSSMTFIAS